MTNCHCHNNDPAPCRTVRVDPGPGLLERVPRPGQRLYQTLALALGLLLLLGLAWPGLARGQVRYGATLSLQEHYSSAVLAQQQARLGDDFITELQPGLTLTYDGQRSALELRYRFSLQVHARTEDSDGHQLLNYSNHLLAGYQLRLNTTTTVALVNRLAQGTENTLVRGLVSEAGDLQAGLPLSTTGFVADWLELSVTQQLSPRWRLVPRLWGRLLRTHDTGDVSSSRATAGDDGARPPHQYGVSAGLEALYALASGELSGAVSLSWAGTQWAAAGQQDGPLLSLVQLEAALGLTWQLQEFLHLRLGAGAAGRLAQQGEAQEAGGVTLQRAGPLEPGIAPIVRAALLYSYGPWLQAQAGYTHRYRTESLAQGTRAGQDDGAFLRLSGALSPWRLDLGGSYTHARLDSMTSDSQEADALHWIAAEATLGVTLLPGVSLAGTYRLDLLEPDGATGGADLPRYQRHMATLGLTVSWPPPVGRAERSLLSPYQEI